MGEAPSWRILPSGLIDRLLHSPEPAARWIAWTGVAGCDPADSSVRQVRADVLADPAVHDLLARVPAWDTPLRLSGHDRPDFAPHLLGLLIRMGVRRGDDPRVDACLDQMLEHQDPDGRFLTCQEQVEPAGGSPASGRWAALACDFHAVLETLAAAGFVDDPRVRRGFACLADDLTDTSQGPGWRCRPDDRVGFRGPGRVRDTCPQVTLQALRAWSYLPPAEHPATLPAAIATALSIWRRRGLEQPYQFGHGRAFKRGKWPATWYSALAVVDTVGRYPQVWMESPDENDRIAVAELAACLRAYTMADDGAVTPHSVYRGYEAHSFGQKRAPSDTATALVAAALVRVEPLAELVDTIDVLALASSKGGSGRVLPP